MEPTNDARVFSKELTALRKTKGLDPKKVEAASESYLQKMENQGRVPSDKMIKALAEEYDHGSLSQVAELIEFGRRQKATQVQQAGRGSDPANNMAYDPKYR